MMLLGWLFSWHGYTYAKNVLVEHSRRVPNRILPRKLLKIILKVNCSRLSPHTLKIAYAYGHSRYLVEGTCKYLSKAKKEEKQFSERKTEQFFGLNLGSCFSKIILDFVLCPRKSRVNRFGSIKYRYDLWLSLYFTHLFLLINKCNRFIEMLLNYSFANL